MKSAFTLALFLSLMWMTARAQTPADTDVRLRALELKVANTGDYMKRYHSERKTGILIGTIGMAAGIAPIYEGIKDSHGGFTALGVVISGGSALFLIGKLLRAERWLKKSGIELSGDAVKFVF